MWNKLGNILNKAGMIFVLCVVVIGVGHVFYVHFSDSEYAVCKRLVKEIDNVESGANIMNRELTRHGLAPSTAFQEIQTILDEKYKSLQCERYSLREIIKKW